MIKNLRPWTSGPIFPERMTAPFVEFEMSPVGWFNLFYAMAFIVFIALVLVHRRRRIDIIPLSSHGVGQFIYFLLLWAFVLGNFARALPGFTGGRLMTEGIITFNAILVTALILTLPRTALEIDEKPPRPMFPTIILLVVTAVAVPIAEWKAVRHIYGDAHSGKRGMNFRFGPNANWKRAPLLRGELHR